MPDALVSRKKYPDFPRLWKTPAAWITPPIGIVGVVYAIYAPPGHWPSALVRMAIVAAYAIVRMKPRKINEKVSLTGMARDIRDRPEHLEGRDEAVAQRLDARGIS